MVRSLIVLSHEFPASCGGFAGVSDSFGSALWALDYGLQMAYSNFSGALLHVGGEDVYYNVSVFFPVPCNSMLIPKLSPSLVWTFPSLGRFCSNMLSHSSSDQSIKFPPVDNWAHILLCACRSVPSHILFFGCSPSNLVAEAFGSSNNSRIIDLGANGDNIYTPGYASTFFPEPFFKIIP